jgi:hypothetical protein
MSQCERCGEPEAHSGDEWEGLMCLDCYYGDKYDHASVIGVGINAEVVPYTYSASILVAENTRLREALERSIYIEEEGYYTAEHSLKLIMETLKRALGEVDE